jgi:RNA polymerase sigma factor (sigma-70 family)
VLDEDGWWSAGPRRRIMGREPAFRIDELLAHADWLRRLARHLVHEGGDEAADAAQDTWVAALRAPPLRDRPAEPWLAEVLRNFVRRRRRTDEARRARDERAGADEHAPVPTPETLLERAQAQRLLVDLVTALDEPFRSTVLLRYFEGLSAAEIARTQNVPAGTVRWRIKEGLDRLRAALDARQRPDRRAWALLLAPLVARGALATLGWKGGLIVTMQKKTVGVLVLLLLALFGGALLWRSPRRPAGETASRTKAAPPTLPPQLRAIALPAGEVMRDDSSAGSVEGIVISALDGAGIAGAELVFALGEAALSARTDADGRFRFAPADAGGYLLARVSADGFRAFATEWGDSPIAFAVRPGEHIRGVKMALRPSRVCRGTVVDEGGKPVPGARVVSYAPGRAGVALVSVESDAQGAFELVGAEEFVEAHHQDRVAREQIAYAVFERCSLRLRLGAAPAGPAVAISGRVEGEGGKPLAGVALEAWTNPVLEPRAHHALARTLSGDDGGFVLSPLDDIPYRITAARGGHEVASVEDVRGGTRDLVLRVGAGGGLRGQVVDAQTGAPVVSFSVVLFTAGAGWPRLWAIFTRYDARGAFAFEDLPAGSYKSIVVAEGRTPSDELSVPIAPGPAAPPALTFRLRAGARLHGQVIDRATRQPIAGARVAIEGKAGLAGSVPLAAEVVSGADGRFELRGAPAGRLSVLVSAAAHHGRVLGGLDMPAAEDLGPLEVDLQPTKEGEQPRIELIGIGAVMAPKGGVIVLGELASSGAAAKAGLVPGDSILAIDGKAIADFGSFGDAVQRIRGAEGTVVLLRVRRADGSEGNVFLTRAPVRGP